MSYCDLHVHSIRSTCGFHTLLEIVTIMRAKKQKAFALTDHGPALETPQAHFSVLTKRMPPVIDGIRVFKGIEASILNYKGEIDIPEFGNYPYEIILAGLHNHDAFANNSGVEKNTLTVVNTMKKYPAVKIISHPAYGDLPVDMDIITSVAVETVTALEINNSHLLNNKTDNERLACMLELAREKGTMLAINSDGHVFSEMGEFYAAIEFMKPFGVNNFNIVNRSFESTLEFLGLEE